jgi:hypothetical protein
MELRGTLSTLAGRNYSGGFLAAKMRRRDVFRAARASLLILPPLIRTGLQLERALSERLGDSTEEMPWEAHVEIDRREFLRKTRDTLAGRRSTAGRARTGFQGPEAVQRRPPPCPAGFPAQLCPA